MVSWKRLFLKKGKKGQQFCQGGASAPLAPQSPSPHSYATDLLKKPTVENFIFCSVWASAKNIAINIICKKNT